MNTVLVSCLCAVIVGARFADAQPTFTSAATATIVHKSAVGDAVITVVATPATGTNSVTYAITTQTPPSPVVFAIDAATGALTVSAALDIQTNPSYVVVVRASEDGGGTTADQTLTITVTNESPSFATTVLAVKIADLAAVDTILTTVVATDPDAGDTITYSITTTSNTNNDFAIDTSGVIKAANAMNRATTPAYILFVTATDTGALAATATVAVCVGSETECPESSASTLCGGYVALLMLLFITIMQ